MGRNQEYDRRDNRDRHDNDDSNREFKQHLKDLEKYQRNFERLKNQCNHQKSNGKYKIDIIRSGIVRCRTCKTTFSTTPINEADIHKAVEILLNMGNQMKLLSKPEELDYVRKVGQVMSYLNDYAELYKKSLDAYGVKNKKNRNFDNSDNYGSIGMGNVAFNKKY